jgi:hypothetical protein
MSVGNVKQGVKKGFCVVSSGFSTPSTKSEGSFGASRTSVSIERGTELHVSRFKYMRTRVIPKRKSSVALVILQPRSTRVRMVWCTHLVPFRMDLRFFSLSLVHHINSVICPSEPPRSRMTRQIESRINRRKDNKSSHFLMYAQDFSVVPA